MKQPIYIRVEPELREWLQKQSDKNRRTLSDYVRMVLEDYWKSFLPKGGR